MSVIKQAGHWVVGTPVGNFRLTSRAAGGLAAGGLAAGGLAAGGPTADLETSQVRMVLLIIRCAIQGMEPEALRLAQEFAGQTTQWGGARALGRLDHRGAQILAEEFERAVHLGSVRFEPAPSLRVRVERPINAAPTAPSDPTPEETTGFFAVRFIDEVEAPIDELKVVFRYLGRDHLAVTDGDGRARVEGVTASFGSVTVSSVAALREKMAPRFAMPRTPTVKLGPHMQAQALEQDFDPVELESTVEETVVITPRFACRAIPAITFEFARTFPRRQGIQRLAEIAEELHQDDGQLAWIFGHTDTSGSELLNKRLSERRARAIWALFRHDFDLWDQLWNAKMKESPWWEMWGTREMQHMLNTLTCPDDSGTPLDEDGNNGKQTRQAVKRFQRRDFPAVPGEQEPLPETGKADLATRKQLFLAYAKLVTREPVAEGRFAKVGSAPLMGCGEFNPLSRAAKDEESRRTVVFIFDPAAQPQGAPCEIANVKPCKAILGPVPGKDLPPPYYRCPFYQKLAGCCTDLGGPDLCHDVILRFFMTLAEANQFPHIFVLEPEDEPVNGDSTLFDHSRTLESDARAVSEGTSPEGAPAPDPADLPLVELYFAHLPTAHRYRLRVEGVDQPYGIFEQVRFHEISEQSAPIEHPRFPGVFAETQKPDPWGERL